MNAPTTNLLPSYLAVGELPLSFHPDRPQDVDIHPLRGIVQFGPYSRTHGLGLRDPVQIAVICPSGELPKVRSLFNELTSGHQPRERPQYLQSFAGFSKVFRVGIDCPSTTTDARVFELQASRLRAASQGPDPQARVSELVLAAVRAAAAKRDAFDLLAVYLPDWLAPSFHSVPTDVDADFDLHDTIKAACASQGIAVQVLNDRALSYACRCSVAWRLSLAIFTKVGGIPWKLSGFDSQHAYVGLSYCLRKGDARRFVTCCSQIFDAEGTNLRFLLYETSDGRQDGDNPYLTREDMRRVMARTIDLYQRQKGRAPTRLVVHKTTPFRDEEVDGCRDALSAVGDLELLTITQDSPWLGIRIDQPPSGAQKGVPAKYPVERGTILTVGHYDYALWTQGNASGIGSGSYFKEGKGIPHPLIVTRHLGSGGVHASGREILGLTKMNWNNDALYDRLPVTLTYASTLARIVKRMGTLNSTPYDFRFFM